MPKDLDNLDLDNEDDIPGLNDDEDEDLGTTPKPAEAEGDVEVNVVDDVPEIDRNRRPITQDVEDPTDKELEEHSAKVQKRLREMTRARQDERRRADQYARENAELLRLAKIREGESRHMQEYISMGQTAYIEKSKGLAQSQVDRAKVSLATALDSGDSAAITAAQESLIAAQISLRDAANLQAAPLPTKQDTAYTPSNTSTTATQVPNVDPQTMAWVKKNPWYQRKGDEDMTGYALRVDSQLRRDNGDSYVYDPAYFKKLDRAMRNAFPERMPTSTNGTTAPADDRPTTVVASTQRVTSAKKVTLTRTQVAIANKLGVSLKDYAKQAIELEKANG